MTLLAWDGISVATDSMIAFGECRHLHTVEKIRVRNGIVFGFTGTGPLFEPMIAWYFAGCKPEDVPKGRDDEFDSTLFVFNDGKAHFYKTELPYPNEQFAPMAWGVGAERVQTALDCGINLRTAMEKAIAREVWLAGPVQIIDLQSLKAEAAPSCEHDWVYSRSDLHASIAVCAKCGTRPEQAA